MEEFEGDLSRQFAAMGRRSQAAGRVFVEHGRKLALGALGLLVAFTAYYQVEPDEVGVVTRFGAYHRVTEPGPHFKIPLGIESVKKVPVQRQLKLEFGFRTVDADVRSEYETPPEAEAESTMLTGDLNVANVEWIVQYKIEDPYQYVFKVRNVTQTLRDMTEATMRGVIGDHSVTEVLTVGREEIQDKAKAQLQALCDQYEMGIEVLQLVLQDVDPPEPVKPSFNGVNQAIQERERAINEAKAAYNRVIPEARGKAAQSIQSAQGYAAERVNRARGDAAAFAAIEAAYAEAPEVTRARLYLETIARVLPNAGPKIFVDDDMKGIVPLLDLGGGRKPPVAASSAKEEGQ